MNCSALNCKNPPTVQCICNNERKFFCAVDLSKHITNYPSMQHQTTAIINEDQNSKAVVLNKLNELIARINKNKIDLTEDFSRIVSCLETKFFHTLKELEGISKSLKIFIDKIESDPNLLGDCRLKRVLFSNISVARQELQIWDSIYNFSINSYDLESSIKNYANITIDLEYLYSENELKVIGSNSNISHESSIIRNDYINNSSNSQSELYRSKDMCLMGHDLKWSAISLLIKNEKDNLLLINCSKCNNSFSSACWVCSKCCEFYLCERCGSSENIKTKAFKCGNNHNLIWRPDACAQYEIEGKGKRFKCRACNKVMNEPSWNCKQCDYDVCQACGSNTFGQSPYFQKPKCKLNHTLTKVNADIINNSRSCDICSRNFIGESYFCKICDYSVCSGCFSYFEKPCAGHPILKCMQMHLMRWEVPERFQCDSCYENLLQAHYQCKQCNFDICLECSNMLVKNAIKPENKTHGENMHPLKWSSKPEDSENSISSCSECNLRFKTGMYCCTMCRNKYCIRCYDNPKQNNIKNKLESNLLHIRN